MQNHGGIPNALDLEGISKAYPGVVALSDVGMSVANGEVHALLGENGAGKSTLLKVLSGIIVADAGTVRIDGKQVVIHTPKAARSAGIAMIHQELQQVPELTVAQNMFLGRSLAWGGAISDHTSMRKMAREHLSKLDPGIDVTAKIGSLRVAQRQLVEIAKATLFKARIIAMDEPTSSLTPLEFERLVEVIEGLSSQGVAVIYVSHKLDEVYRVAGLATVLRDGKKVGEVSLSNVRESELVSLMVGRGISAKKRVSHAQTQPILKVENLARGIAVQSASFELRKGEVLGIAGLVGSGRSELVRLIAGLDKRTDGAIAIDGKQVSFATARQAITAGIALLPEDRKKEGIIPLRSVRSNAALPNFKEFSKAGIVNASALRATTLQLAEQVNLRPLDPERRISLFSGGNQQKAILVRWLMANARVMVFDEPTRGIDVGAKEEIYQLIESLAAEGRGIIVVSSELAEILRVADRVLVMRAGCVAGVLEQHEVSQETIMSLAFSKTERGAAWAVAISCSNP